MGKGEPMSVRTFGECQRQEVSKLMLEGCFDDAAEILSVADKAHCLQAIDLLSFSRAIQLGSENSRFSLECAKALLHKALEFEPSNSLVLEELGWFYHSVEDDSKKGMFYFKKAVSLNRERLTSSSQGLARCVAEEESVDEAAASLRRVHRSALNVGQLADEEKSWLKTES